MPAAPPLKYLVYASTAVGTPSEETMTDIMEVAQSHNDRAGITGFLLARNFTYVQFLEGPLEEIDSLMRSISRDIRHHSIQILIEEPTAQRRFPKWSMHYRLPAPDAVNPYGPVTSDVDSMLGANSYTVIYEAAEKVSTWLVSSES